MSRRQMLVEHIPESAIGRVVSHHSRSREDTGDDESGAILILALVFLVAVSLIVTSLLTWVGTSLSATGAFANERTLEYAATDAVNLAIQNTRYTFDAGSPAAFLNNATPEQCANPPGNPVTVYCSMVWQPYSANTRVFTYSACNYTSPPANPAADCAAKPLLQVMVAFDDYPSGVASPSPTPRGCTPITPGNGSCGESMTQLSWQWHPQVPVVASITPALGPTTGGTSVTIQGTGFTSGETVNFLELANQLPTLTSYNPPAAATIAPPTGTCPVSTCVQVTSPPILNGTSYFVTVTTPGGTSQTGPNDSTSFVPIFTYSPVQPTVTGLVGTVAGQITGNTTVTIQGTGFWSAANNTFPAQAFFCPTGGGACVAGSVVSVSPPATGSTLDSMAVVTPSVSSAGTYYVQVEVFNLRSTSTSAIFTYSVQAPLIVSLSPSSGATGSTLTISGANFLNLSTVGLCAWLASPPQNYSTTCTQTAAPVVSATPTTLVVTIPALAAANYYPIVSLPSSFNTPPSQPYNQAGDIFQHT